MIQLKIKTIQLFTQKLPAAFGALFMLLSAVFLYPVNVANASTTQTATYNNGCKVSVFFMVTDVNGAEISKLANKDTRFILYTKYTFDTSSPACRVETLNHRFRQVSNTGSFDYIGPQENVNGINVEKKLTWQTSGLKDFNNFSQYVQNNGSVKLEAYLATAAGVEVVKSPGILITVGNETTAPPGQSVGAGNTQGTGTVQVTTEKNKGLVPCGRDSAVTGNGPAGPRPGDTCTVNDLFNLMIRVTNYLILLSGFFATFQIIRSAFSMVLAQGSPEGISGAKKHLTNAVLGLVLALMAFILINTVVGLLGLKGGQNILTNPIEYLTN